jgi:hypothetical protein
MMDKLDCGDDPVDFNLPKDTAIELERKFPRPHDAGSMRGMRGWLRATGRSGTGQRDDSDDKDRIWDNC